ncbi:Outer membrane protein (OmpH-like) [Falsiruegeria litorea R37]|uniref:Outer membrane protein (OmpH-like) n=1 Tax=Falsiruegeria litorea R37 TaxID=1200284 RepID=A0A1Y5SC83_9RHOB|nr:OmpH family outer membrane protein [Falsiruegeria litorea]SLN37428.1 Outer membrane protein (OmpH-like) [Falsiruegeria litorea R37]
MKRIFAFANAQGLFLALCFVFWGLGAAQTGQAQQLGVAQSQVLTISIEALFARSQFGQRVANEIDAESAVLAAENRRIEGELEQEEQELTERRNTIDADSFRVLADAFDQKVQSHRATQKRKYEALNQKGDIARAEFLQVIVPILEDLRREAGAAVLIEQSTVILADPTADITEIAISRVDVALGDGSRIAPEAKQ